MVHKKARLILEKRRGEGGRGGIFSQSIGLGELGEERSRKGEEIGR